MSLRVIIAGGGTGGHVIPAIAIARELTATHGAEVLFVGTSRGMENRLVPAAGFSLRLIDVGALKNVGLVKRFKTLWTLPRAIFAASRLISEFKPQVVIGVGGYASGPMMIAAVLRRVPTLIFEPNFVPGLANRAVAPLVTTAVVHFEETGAYFRRFVVTGVPVRHAFFELPPRGGQGEHPTLLVFGGSQGAAAINKVVIESLPELAGRVPGLHIVHQTGERDYNSAQAAYLRAPVAAEVSPFIDDMPGAFARADLVVCRSGAGAVSELAAAGKPSILVPFPFAAGDHQTRNAEVLQRGGAARLIPDADLTGERLFSTVAELAGQSGRLEQMAEAARKFARPGAARRAAEILEQAA